MGNLANGLTPEDILRLKKETDCKLEILNAINNNIMI